MEYWRKISTRNVFCVVFAIAVLSLFRPTLFDSYSHSHRVIKSDASTLGIDVSHHQGEIDWGQVIQHDTVDFVFVKATEGIHFVDPKYQYNSSTLKRTKIPFGSYHFFHPDKDPLQQAQFFIRNIDNNAALPAVLDIEIHHAMSVEQIQKSALIWLRHVEMKTGCKPIIYTNLSYWFSYLSEGFEAYPLWLAEYNSHLSFPEKMKIPSIWQKTNKAEIKGVNAMVDLDQLIKPLSSLEALKC